MFGILSDLRDATPRLTMETGADPAGGGSTTGGVVCRSGIGPAPGLGGGISPRDRTDRPRYFPSSDEDSRRRWGKDKVLSGRARFS